jgi:hypothetical protein
MTAPARTLLLCFALSASACRRERHETTLPVAPSVPPVVADARDASVRPIASERHASPTAQSDSERCANVAGAVEARRETTYETPSRADVQQAMRVVTNAARQCFAPRARSEFVWIRFVFDSTGEVCAVDSSDDGTVGHLGMTFDLEGENTLATVSRAERDCALAHFRRALVPSFRSPSFEVTYPVHLPIR